MSLFTDILQGMLDMFFPEYCVHCGTHLLPGEHFLCTDCQLDLATVTFNNFRDNTLTRLFWGRLPVKYAFAFMHFSSHSPAQSILHELKYNHNKEIGLYYGQTMGKLMKDQGFPDDFDVIIPVPLHPKKLDIRGYNQAQLLAQGIAESYHKPLVTHAVHRTRFNPTQTKKSMTQRWENVKNLFAVSHPRQLKGKHILIVDDVITTGSTIESLATEILKVPSTSISIALLAMAQQI